MNLTQWKTAAAENLEKLARGIKALAPGALYGFLASSTVFPLVVAANQAINQGDYATLMALGGLASGVGADLIADQIIKWRDRSQAELAAELQERAESDPEWLETLDALLVHFEAPLVVQTILAEADRDWFTRTLRQELDRLGSSVDVYVAGSVKKSVIVTGDNNSVTYIVNKYRVEGGDLLDQERQERLRHQIAGYLGWLKERYGAIELRGIKREGQQVVQLDLETVYVPLQAETGGRQSLPLDQLLSQGKRLIVTGGPGSGKTTVLQHIAWTLATAIANDHPALAHQKLQLTDEAPPLPIFVPLSAYAQHLRHLPPSVAARERTLAAFISRHLIEKQSELDLPSDFFARLLRDGQAVILLLDGLDEVPDENERAQVRQAIEDLVSGREQMRVVVTCRTAAYRGRTALGRGFRSVRVKELETGHIEALVRRAYAAIHPDDPTARRRKADELLQGIDHLEQERRRRLGQEADRLVTSPLLVRMLLVVHYSERRLPEQRAELYMKATDAMLLPEYLLDEEVASRIGGLVGGSREAHRELAQHLAFVMHRRGPEQGREIGEDDLRRVLAGNDAYAPLAQGFIALTRLRGTLLEERLEVYRFIHLAFQEYLAARYLAEIVRSEEGMAAFLEEGPILESWWREPALLAVGYLGANSPQTARLFLRRLAGLDEGAAQRSQALSADVQVAAAEVATTAYLEWQALSESLGGELAQRLVALLSDRALSVPGPLRAAAGVVLGRLGDPRFRSGDDGWHLPAEPLLGFVEIAAGPFLMGSDKRRDRLADDDELPQHEVSLPAYYIARYPVTVAQFRAFVEDSRHKAADQRSLEGVANHPVAYVTWHDAVAYCQWLTERLRGWAGTPEPLAGLLRDQGWRIRLPSEAEWEKAARGADGRRYPWGEEITPDHANYVKTGIGSTTAVGIFPGGASPYGVLDLSGNVWEWCCTKWRDDYTTAPDDDLAGEAGRVVRGGSYFYDAGVVRCAVRFRHGPYDRYMDVGFRIVVLPPHHS